MASQQDIQNLINSYIIDNNTGAINPAKLREVLTTINISIPGGSSTNINAIPPLYLDGFTGDLTLNESQIQAFISKIEKENITVNLDDTATAIYLPGPSANLTITGDVTDIHYVSTPVNSYLYSGRKLILRNETGHDITLHHLESTAFRFRFPNNENFIWQPNETIEFSLKITGTNTGYYDFIGSIDTKESIGLGNVDNTSDMDKPVSDAQSMALDLKLDASAYNDRFSGKYISLSALNAAHPTANDGDYAIVDSGVGNDAKEYIWDNEDGWVLAGTNLAASTTDALAEGSTNLYHTSARVLATILSGFSTTVGGSVVNTDSVLQAFGKFQNQLNAFLYANNFIAKATTLVDADLMVVGDSADSFKTKTRTFAQLKITLGDLYKSWFLGINAVAGITYTIGLNDYKNRNVFTSTNPVAFTVPTNASVAIPIGATIESTVQGTGAVTVGGAGITFVQKNLVFTTGDTFYLTKIATDTWSVDGNPVSTTTKVNNTYFVDTVKGSNTTGVFEDESKPFATIDYVLGLSLTDNVTIVLQNVATFTMNTAITSNINVNITSTKACTLDISGNANTILHTGSGVQLSIIIPNGTLKNNRASSGAGTVLNSAVTHLFLRLQELYWNCSSNLIQYAGSGNQTSYIDIRKVQCAYTTTEFFKTMNGYVTPIDEVVCLVNNVNVGVYISSAPSTSVTEIKKLSGSGSLAMTSGRYKIGDIVTTGTCIVSGYAGVWFLNSVITSAGGIKVSDGYPTGGVVISGFICSCPKIFTDYGQNGAIYFVNF